MALQALVALLRGKSRAEPIPVCRLEMREDKFGDNPAQKHLVHLPQRPPTRTGLGDWHLSLCLSPPSSRISCSPGVHPNRIRRVLKAGSSAFPEGRTQAFTTPSTWHTCMISARGHGSQILQRSGWPPKSPRRRSIATRSSWSFSSTLERYKADAPETESQVADHRSIRQKPSTPPCKSSRMTLTVPCLHS